MCLLTVGVWSTQARVSITRARLSGQVVCGRVFHVQEADSVGKIRRLTMCPESTTL